MLNGGTIFDSLKVQLDSLVCDSPMEDTENFRKRKAGCGCSNKWSSNRLSGEEGHSAAVEFPIGEQFLICGTLLKILFTLGSFPDCICSPRPWQSVETQRSKILVTAPNPGLDYHGETNFVERAPAKRVVDTAESNSRFVCLALEVATKQTFMAYSAEPPLFRPRGHGASLF